MNFLKWVYLRKNKPSCLCQFWLGANVHGVWDGVFRKENVLSSVL